MLGLSLCIILRRYWVGRKCFGGYSITAAAEMGAVHGLKLVELCSEFTQI
jgi:hypothetical protein